MSFHIDLKSLNLDNETAARISTKVGALVLGEIANLDLSDNTTIIGKLGPGTRGIIAIKDLQSLADIAKHEAIKGF